MSKSKTPTVDVDEQYEWISDPLELVMAKSHIYVGDIELTEAKMWVYDDEEKQLVLKDIVYSPGFYKIFDELIVNAADHVVRCEKKGWERVTTIKININDEGQISVWNNGQGIPVVKSKKHDMYAPTLIFGHIGSGSNMRKVEDVTDRMIGGTNGMGATLAIVFSTEATVETIDSNEGKKFVQTFSDNLKVKGEPVITRTKNKPYTCVTIDPDYERFGLEGMTDDIYALFKKRVYDLVLIPGIKVYFNDEEIKLQGRGDNFTKYIDLYFPEGSEYKKVIDVSNEHWKIGVIYDPDDNLHSKNISFVNSICTSRGGSHVEYITNQITKKINAAVQAKLKKDTTVQTKHIKQCLGFFIDARVGSPVFDGQTKEFLTSKVKDYGTKYAAPQDFLDKIVKIGIVEKLALLASVSNDAEFEKATKTRRGIGHIPKLSDATDANDRDGSCVLILTEGDSAKTLAMAGRTDNAKYGVFPLKGKLLNVRECSMKKILENAEIQNIIKIVGLTPGKKYTSSADLRYGKIMIFADQDHDGNHIKGLLINMIHHFWPSLVKDCEFITTLATPIIKATRKTNPKDVISFYSITDYGKWQANDPNVAGKYSIKYYKGLGTSTSKEAKEYFKDIDKKLVTYNWPACPKGKKDPTDDVVDKIFNPKRANDRKVWIKNNDPSRTLDYNKRSVDYIDFFDTEMRAFSLYDTERSIPNLVDGQKTSLRKILFACIKKRIAGEIKVAQLQGYVSENTNYHHGEESLSKAIVGMAQTYVGSNNINFLHPGGQFGSRLQGGKDSASARYIFTRLSHITNYVFVPIDSKIVDYIDDDGTLVEPHFYLPVIPTILVNGAEGIGSGYSTSIPPTNPRVLIDNVRRLIHDKPLKKMVPWYHGFTGRIDKETEQKYITRASYTINKDLLIITDLPIGVWTEKWEDKIKEAIHEANTKTPIKAKDGKKVVKKTTIWDDIKSVKPQISDVIVYYEIQFKPNTLAKYVDEDNSLEKLLGLTSLVHLSNMWLWDEEGKLCKYESYEEILRAFFSVRYGYYQVRKDYQLRKLVKAIDKNKAILKYILSVLEDTETAFSRNLKEINEYLAENDYPKFKPSGSKDSKPSYSYILNIKLYECSDEEVERLRNSIKLARAEINELKKKTPGELWETDLDNLEAAYEDFCNERLALLADDDDNKPKKKVPKKVVKRAPAKKAPAKK